MLKCSIVQDKFKILEQGLPQLGFEPLSCQAKPAAALGKRVTGNSSPFYG